MRYVQIVQVSGVFSISQMSRFVQARYPQARMQLGDIPKTVVIVLPDLTWSLAPGGDKDFFCTLCRTGVIRDYAHRRYSDWPEEVAR